MLVGAAGNSESEVRRYARRASLLSLGVGLAGLITYLFFALASRNLSPGEYGELTVLWSTVFITVGVLHRPGEQLVARTVSQRQAKRVELGSALRAATILQVGISLALVAVALGLKGSIEEGLFVGNATFYWIGLVSVAAYGASYLARGFLAGSHRHGLYALLILSESLIRTSFPLAVAFGMATGQATIAMGIVAAPVCSLLIATVAFVRRGHGRDESAPRPAVDSNFGIVRAGGFTVAALLIMAGEQAFLNAGPLLVSGRAGAEAAGYFFNLLMIARAPLQLFQAVTASLLPHLTRLRSTGKDGEFRASVRVTIIGIAAFSIAMGVTMAVAGPTLMQLAFGAEFTYPRVDLLIVTAGMGMFLAAETLSQAALAHGRVREAAVCWVASAIAFVAWVALPVGSPEGRSVELGYLGATSLLCALLYAIYSEPYVRPPSRRTKSKQGLPSSASR